MNHRSVHETIAARRAAGQGTLVGYLPIGFPNLDTSIEAAIALGNNGVDVIEFGIPYSDPVMDGPVIQAATTEALAKGFRLREAFDAVEAVRAAVNVPVLLMTYWNPVLQYGPDPFAARLREVGGSGLITPDLIPDEAGLWLDASEAHDLERVFLAAPTSTDERLRMISEASTGFVYVVSTMGITGARSHVDAAARKLTERLRAVTDNHLCVGLGISNADQVREVLSYADGAIVGSALVKALASGGVSAVTETAAMLAAGKHAV